MQTGNEDKCHTVQTRCQLRNRKNTNEDRNRDDIYNKLIKNVEIKKIQNSKNSKPFKSSKKNDQIWTKKHYPNLTIMRKTNKKGGMKKEGNLPKPLPSFSFFIPTLSLFPTIYIKAKKIKNNLRDVSVLFQHPLKSWDSRKKYLKIISHLLP